MQSALHSRYRSLKLETEAQNIKEKTRSMAKGKSGENKAQEKSNSKNQRSERIREYLFDFGWFFLDLWFVWPASHVWAIFFASYLIGIHLLTSSLESKRKAIFGVLWLGCTAFLIWIIPPTESETHGFLIPADAPAPQDACKFSIAPNTARIYFGGSEAATFKGTAVIALEVANRPILAFRLTDKGLVVTGEIHTQNGITAFLVNNEFWINPNLSFHSEHPDRSTLIVRDNMGITNLEIRYLNSTAIVFTGHFFFSDIGEILITDKSRSVKSKSARSVISSFCEEDTLNYPVLIDITSDGRIFIGSAKL
jgi:hypothetical protein